MKTRLHFSLLVLLLTAYTHWDAAAQGCVAVRNMSSGYFGNDSTQMRGLQFSLNYRYFRSYKHFRGREEEKNRVEEGSEVINNDNSILLGISYSLNRKWSLSTTIPYLNIDRSSLYEHYGNPSNSNPTINPRFHTQAVGVGDVRISTYYSAIQKQRV